MPRSIERVGALLRDVRRQSGDPVEAVILAVAVRYCIVPMAGNRTFGEVSEEVRGLKEENASLKKSLAEAILERRERLEEETLVRRRAANTKPQGPEGEKPYFRSALENSHSF